jgi:hypothetical protein
MLVREGQAVRCRREQVRGHHFVERGKQGA